MELYKKELSLSNESIDTAVSEVTEAYFALKKKPETSQHRFSLAIEELLLCFRDSFGAETPCRVLLVRRFGKFFFELSQTGPRGEWVGFGEDSRLSYDILARLGVVPRYTFAAGSRNRVTWEIGACERKKSMVYSMVAALVLAVIAGILLNLAPVSLHDTLLNDLVSPVFAKLTAVLSAVATPMVFFAVIAGIIGIGDVKAFGKIGLKMLLYMFLGYGISTVCLALGSAVAYGFAPASAAAGEGSQLSGVVQMALDIVPDNLFVPFSIDNDLQVIVISVFVGITMLILGDRISRLNDFVRECSDLLNKMMSICCKFLPLIIFFGVIKLIGTSNVKQFARIGSVLIVYCGMNLVFITIMYLRACLATKTSPKVIFKKQIATLMINLTTQSQVAALPENMKCCKQKFGIDGKFIDFALPLGIVVYMPSGSIYLGLVMVSMGLLAGIPLTVGLMLRIMVLCVIIAISAPPIPGGALVMLPVTLASCGIPNDVLPLALIVATLIGYVLPAFNGINIQLELLVVSKKIGKLDLDTLRTPYKESEEAKPQSVVLP